MYWIFFLIGIKINWLGLQIINILLFATYKPYWTLKFDSYSNFILPLILFEVTCYFRNKTIFWLVFNWFSNSYFWSVNDTHFIVYYLRIFELFKFNLYCLLAFFIWNDSRILRQNIFPNSFYLFSKLSDLARKLHTFCFPFVRILFGI